MQTNLLQSFRVTSPMLCIPQNVCTPHNILYSIHHTSALSNGTSPARSNQNESAMKAQTLLPSNVFNRSVVQARNSVLPLTRSRINGTCLPRGARDRFGCTPFALRSYGTANPARQMAVVGQATGSAEDITSKRVCLVVVAPSSRLILLVIIGCVSGDCTGTLVPSRGCLSFTHPEDSKHEAV